MSPCPVMTITGKRSFVFLTRSSSSIPVISGIRTSVMMQPASASAMLARKSFADSYVRTRTPAASSMKRSESRAASSSSITCTKPSFCIREFLSGHVTEREVEDRAALRIGPHADAAVMRLDNRAADLQADAHAMDLGGEERLKQLPGDFIGDARARVGDADLDHSAVGRHDGHGELAPPCLGH